MSDGGHHENLGVYSLVRRGCRYIIASDAGADPVYAMEDLANMMRKLRVDFGIDVTMDLSGLRPDPLTKRHIRIDPIIGRPKSRTTCDELKAGPRVTANAIRGGEAERDFFDGAIICKPVLDCVRARIRKFLDGDLCLLHAGGEQIMPTHG